MIKNEYDFLDELGESTYLDTAAPVGADIVKSCNMSISILNVNLRSLPGNFCKLQAFLSMTKLKFTIIVITESHLDDQIDSLFVLPGYRSLFLHRNRSGVALLHFAGRV